MFYFVFIYSVHNQQIKQTGTFTSCFQVFTKKVTHGGVDIECIISGVESQLIVLHVAIDGHHVDIVSKHVQAIGAGDKKEI